MARRKSTEAPEPLPVIPTVIPPAAPVLTAEQRLAAKAKKAEPKAAASKDWLVTLTEPQQIENALQFCAANHGSKVLDGKASAARAELQPSLIRIVAEEWIKQKRRMPNPKISTSEVNFNFVCADSDGFSLKPDKDGNLRTADEHFAAYGVDPIVRKVLSQEFEEKSGLSLELSKMKEKKPALYERVVNLLLVANEDGVYDKDGKPLDKFSDEEVNDMLVRNNAITCKEGFVDRLPTAVGGAFYDQTKAADQMVNVLTALSAVNGLQWRIGQVFVKDPAPLVQTMIAAPVVAGPQPEQTFTTSDKMYEIIVKDDTATLVKITDGVKKTIGTRKCANGYDHAINTAKLWQRDRGRLNEAITDMI